MLANLPENKVLRGCPCAIESLPYQDLSVGQSSLLMVGQRIANDVACAATTREHLDLAELIPANSNVERTVTDGGKYGVPRFVDRNTPIVVRVELIGLYEYKS